MSFGEQRSGELVGEVVGGGRPAPHQRRDGTADADVEGFPAAFDQSVGVEQQGGPSWQRRVGFGTVDGIDNGQRR